MSVNKSYSQRAPRALSNPLRSRFLGKPSRAPPRVLAHLWMTRPSCGNGVHRGLCERRISNRWVSGYDWVTEILVWGYAPAGGRRPLFRVWGYAPTRESVISHILSHTIARRGHGLRSLPWTFTERAWKEHHGAPGGVHHEFTTHHESLVALLPPDTTCADLFGEVENSRDQDTGSQGYACMLPGLSRPYSYHLWKVAVQGYGGMLCRAATRPSTVYGGMPVGLFGHPIIP